MGTTCLESFHDSGMDGDNNKPVTAGPTSKPLHQ